MILFLPFPSICLNLHYRNDEWFGKNQNSRCRQKGKYIFVNVCVCVCVCVVTQIHIIHFFLTFSLCQLFDGGYMSHEKVNLNPAWINYIFFFCCCWCPAPPPHPSTHSTNWNFIRREIVLNSRNCFDARIENIRKGEFTTLERENSQH